MKISDKHESLSHRAHLILARRNKDERSVFVKNALGDANVRGGSSVMLDLDEFRGRATVLKCTHKLSEKQHLMDLLIGV